MCLYFSEAFWRKCTEPSTCSIHTMVEVTNSTVLFTSNTIFHSRPSTLHYYCLLYYSTAWGFRPGKEFFEAEDDEHPPCSFLFFNDRVYLHHTYRSGPSLRSTLSEE